MLTLSLNNALSGLRASQQSLAVISQNIANVNNPNYTRQILNQESVNLGGEVGSGVRVSEVTRAIDEFIARTVVIRGSDVAKTDTVRNYYDQAQLYFGQPGSKNSIDAYTDNFFNALNTIQANPKNAAVKQYAVSMAQTLSAEISNLAKNIEDLRFQADKAIEEAVEQVNFEINKIQDLNTAILSARATNSSVTSLQDEIQQSLRTLAEMIDINYTFDANGTATVTGAGQTLLSSSVKYALDYTASTSVEDFYGNLELDAIKTYAVQLDGTLEEEHTAILATSGFESGVTTTIQSGKIKGLLDIRDNLLPNMLSQLDNLSADLRDEFNAIHNQGTSYPPPTALTGDRLVSPTQALDWSGSIKLAALNADGTAFTSVYGSDSAAGMPPLDLDLSTLDDGNGVGSPTLQTIIDEINWYYGAPQNRVTIGPLNNINLVSKDDAIDSNSGTFEFNLEYSNFGISDADVVITGVTVSNGGTVTTPSSFPTSSLTIDAGSRERNSSFALDMSTGAGTSFNVSIAIQVTDDDGTVHTDTITYAISDATSDKLNQRYVASAVSGSGDATIEAPSSTDQIMRAILVDAEGNEVDKDATTGDYTESGYLKIYGIDAESFGIIDNGSAEGGHASDDIDATGRGFSHYYGLNNFFKETVTGSEDAAIYMAVRDDIVENPSLLAVGTLSASNLDEEVADYSYEIGESSASTIDDLVNLNVNTRTFAAAGEMPAIAVTFSGYASQILGVLSTVTANAIEDARQNQLIYDGFKEKHNNISGVNIDEEMANTIIYQNSYTANARVISVVKEMFDTLINTF